MEFGVTKGGRSLLTMSIRGAVKTEMAVLVLIALAVSGCNSPKVIKEPPPPAPPPPVPAVKNEPINQPLRQLARSELAQALNSENAPVRARAVEVAQDC